MCVGIIDIGISNIDSIKKIIKSCGVDYILISDCDNYQDSIEKVIFPGVGNFNHVIQIIKNRNLDKILKHHFSRDKSYLGICIGMQLLSEFGEEGGKTMGLNYLPGHTTKLLAKSQYDLIPHNGWNTVIFDKEDAIFKNIDNERDFYFNHSYHLITEREYVLATTPHCGGIISAVRKGNIYGFQFHPEKSQKNGIQLIRNFLSND